LVRSNAGNYAHIGEGTVLYTVKSLPTGIQATIQIGEYTIIGPGCTLSSCIIQDNVKVCANSVIMEGAILESGCVVGAGSVVPPGRMIPKYQFWTGNPVEYCLNVGLLGI
jgi:carbonic anhydrase/acetyltransferase-like protein (isoleucine patch superfamily)